MTAQHIYRKEPSVAEKVVRELIDDLDGEPADTTVKFGYDGRDYEIDLSDKNAEVFDNFLADYIDKGRRIAATLAGTRGPKSAGVRKSYARKDSNTSAIREWAREQGLPVSDRGRVSRDIQAQYDAAH